MPQKIEVAKAFGVVYRVVNLANGKCYVGQTVQTLKSRWQRHCRPEGSGCAALSSAIAKYGVESFDIEVVCSAFSADELNSLEAFAIVEFNTMSPSGYNLRSGGGSKGSHSDASKSKMAAAHTQPELLEKHRAAMSKRWEDPAYQADMAAKAKARWTNPEFVERSRAAMLMAAAKPETKMRKSAATKAYLARGGAAIVKAAQNTPEALAKRKESVKRLWEDPVHVAKAKAAAKLAFTDSKKAALRGAGMARLAALDTPVRPDSVSGIRGVRQDPSSGKWEARVALPQVGPTYLGIFDSAEEASAAYLAAKKAILLGEPVVRHLRLRQRLVDVGLASG